MPLDVQDTIFQRVWELLEASTAFTDLVKLGNRIKDDEPKPEQRDRAKSGDAPADFPKVRVKVQDDAGGRGAPRTFCMNATDFTPATCDYGVPMTLNLEIVIVYKADSDLTKQTPLEAAIRGALLSRGPNMGIGWISGTEWREPSRRPERNAETGTTERPVTRLRLTVNARPMLTLLTN